MTQFKGRKPWGPPEVARQSINVYLLISYKHSQTWRRYCLYPRRIYRRVRERNTEKAKVQGTVLKEMSKQRIIL